MDSVYCAVRIGTFYESVSEVNFWP